MERADVAALGERILADFVVRAPGNPADSYALRTTSGTSGEGPLMFVQQLNPLKLSRFADGSDVAVVVGSRMMRLMQAMLIRRNGAPQQRMMLLDGKDIAPDLTESLQQFAPKALFGFPSSVARMSEHISESARQIVKEIVSVGEQVWSTTERYLQEQYPNARVVSFYGSAETGPLSEDTCAFSPTTVYHPLPGVLIEIDNPDEQGIGDILVTKVVYHDKKLSRYRIGDDGAMVKGPCRCGATASFKMLGRRGYDFIRVQGALLLKEEFDRVAGSLKEYISDYRAEAFTTKTHVGLRGGITLSVYRKTGTLSPTELERVRTLFAERLFISTTLTLAAAVDKHYFIPLEVVAVAQPFPKGHKDVSLRLRQS